MCLALYFCLLYLYCIAAQGKTEAALLSRSILWSDTIRVRRSGP